MDVFASFTAREALVDVQQTANSEPRSGTRRKGWQGQTAEFTIVRRCRSRRAKRQRALCRYPELPAAMSQELTQGTLRANPMLFCRLSGGPLSRLR